MKLMMVWIIWGMLVLGLAISCCVVIECVCGWGYCMVIVLSSMYMYVYAYAYVVAICIALASLYIYMMCLLGRRWRRVLWISRIMVWLRFMGLGWYVIHLGLVFVRLLVG